MNPELSKILNQANKVFNHAPAQRGYRGQVHVGVDLGTAYTVMVVLDDHFKPLAGKYQFAEIVRDGLVVDFIGAIGLVKKMKAELEGQLGFRLTQAATTYPPGVPQAEVKATQNVLIGAGLDCREFIDEPTGANALLQAQDGVVVDVGGGTTGIAVIEKGKVVYTADEPTGGTHFSLVIAGALDIPFAQAEAMKVHPNHAKEVLPLVYPVMQKVGSIVARHIKSYPVKTIYMVGGTSSMPGISEVVEEMTGVKTYTPPHPMFVTPIGAAMYNR